MICQYVWLLSHVIKWCSEQKSMKFHLRWISKAQVVHKLRENRKEHATITLANEWHEDPQESHNILLYWLYQFVALLIHKIAFSYATIAIICSWICSMQFANLRNFKIALCKLEISKFANQFRNCAAQIRNRETQKTWIGTI